ncbi:hypothetical protein ACJX0J_028246 [Zea mays]
MRLFVIFIPLCLMLKFFCLFSKAEEHNGVFSSSLCSSFLYKILLVYAIFAIQLLHCASSLFCDFYHNLDGIETLFLPVILNCSLKRLIQIQILGCSSLLYWSFQIGMYTKEKTNLLLKMNQVPWADHHLSGIFSKRVEITKNTSRAKAFGQILAHNDDKENLIWTLYVYV